MKQMLEVERILRIARDFVLLSRKDIERGIALEEPESYTKKVLYNELLLRIGEFSITRKSFEFI